MSNCPRSNLENRIKNLEEAYIAQTAMLVSTIDILKKYGIIDSCELDEKIKEYYDDLKLKVLQPISKTIH